LNIKGLEAPVRHIDVVLFRRVRITTSGSMHNALESKDPTLRAHAAKPLAN
jgi:hypothetical protein